MTRVITDQDLHHSSAAVIRAVEAGETIVVTRDGRPIAELRPLTRHRILPTASIVRAMRGLPRVDVTGLRAESDRLFGWDGISG